MDVENTMKLEKVMAAAMEEEEDGLKQAVKKLNLMSQSVEALNNQVEANTESITILTHNQAVEYHEQVYQSAVLLQVIQEVSNTIMNHITPSFNDWHSHSVVTGHV